MSVHPDPLMTLADWSKVIDPKGGLAELLPLIEAHPQFERSDLMTQAAFLNLISILRAERRPPLDLKGIT